DSKPKYVRLSTREKTNQAPKDYLGKRLKTTAKMAKSGKKKLLAQGLETLSEIAFEEDNDDEVSMSKDDDNNADNEDDDDHDDDNEQTESDNDGDDFVHPKFSTHNEEVRQDEEDKEEECSDLRVHTPSHFESTNDEAYDEVTQGENVKEEKLDEEKINKDEEVNEMYNDVNINLEGRDTEMTDALLANVQATQVIEDTHVIITVVSPKVQQQSSFLSSGFISKMLNPIPDTGIDSILNLNTGSTSLVDVPVTTHDVIPPSSVTTLPPPTIPLIQPLQQTPVSTPTIVPSTSLQNLSTFGSLFKFEDRVKSLENDFLEFKQTNLFVEAVSSILGIVDKYLANQMNEAVKEAVQLQSDRLREETHAENEEFINKIDENMKKIIKEQVKVQVKEQVSKILPRIEKSVNEQLEAEVLIRSSNEAKTSHANLYKALVDAYETDKDILATYVDAVTFKRRQDDEDDDEDDDEEPSAGSNRGSTEYFLEEVYKATTDQLDWNNSEGQQYPHDIRKPLPLIPNSRGCRVIPFDHFINNDLAYLSGGVSSRTYATSVMNTKAAEYGHIKWIEDLVPNTMWSQVLIVYKKHAFWGISYWGLKCQQFYGFAVNLESARDITVRRDDDKLYTFKEGDYKRLHLQDIEDMLLLLNKDKKNRLMHIDELHKFSDGTLIDVRSALDDILKRIRMEYLP
ncbi:hypothetical protein Tco_1079339, partial [Tanacetum coccineum]